MMAIPSIEKFTPRTIGEKPWGEEWLVACTEHYTGKVLRMKAGHRGGLRTTSCDETFYLFSVSVACGLSERACCRKR
jgi:hypothetical protein